ncbi:uncharacterized protein LOC127864534 [Dreissena polymorpha]|uniref:uncharacterized protein LOC127864534 n=1 Tax=Dreissena polymorpha TaxID=45954 RepID=UPI0022652180|nr:uncharacterized protein LOC127864534 [Dreissena polymorpha]
MEDDSDYDEFSVQPYMYEPEFSDSQSDFSDSDSGSEDNFADAQDDHRIECKCCTEYPELMERMDEAGVKCITEHTGFKANCLHPDVIEVSFYEFLDVNGPIGDEEPIHEVYRYISYRRLARWIWHRLSKKDRRPLPSCAVAAIRQRFPSDSYIGFCFARDGN